LLKLGEIRNKQAICTHIFLTYLLVKKKIHLEFPRFPLILIVTKEKQKDSFQKTG
jgi:hypothetical protein